jgi:peptidylprolyl isomerase
LKAPPSAQRTPSGLASQLLKAGTGESRPTATDRVKMRYAGWQEDGTLFDDSSKRAELDVFPVASVIPGLTEGLQMMTVGEKRRFWIPAQLAYGDASVGGAPSGNLIFDIELVEIVAQPSAPLDVQAPPASAKRTASGLAYRVLTKGSGRVHPVASSRVKVHYSGWTTDGNLFDSSVTRGKPATFPLSSVIKGWTEGLQLMVVGEKTRFWIPADLAYGNAPKRPGAPAGMLVFDIELFEIDPAN